MANRRRARRIVALATWIFTSLAAVACSSHGHAEPTVATPVVRGIEQIEHVIFVVQENRSFDEIFGTFPGADGIPRRPDGSLADRSWRHPRSPSAVEQAGWPPAGGEG